MSDASDDVQPDIDPPDDDTGSGDQDTRDSGRRGTLDHDRDLGIHDQESHEAALLDTSDRDRSSRATGDTNGGVPASERATGSGDSDLLGGRDPLGAFGDSKSRDSDYHLLDRSLSDLLQDGTAPQPGERSVDWIGQDLEALGKGVQALKDFVADFFAGIGDFLSNYHEMIAVNTKGADRFFHCQANCQAASRGAGGLLAAKTISYGREATDLPKNAVKGISWKDNLADCKGDLAADRAGWDAGSRGLRCSDVCNGYRPKGL
jgi:hypothetical protein